MSKNLIVFIAVAFAVLRFFQPTHALSLSGSYEAFAHLFLGGLIGAWLLSKDNFYRNLVVALSLIEVIAFFTLKK